MAHIGLMIEGQEDLTWERLFRLAQAAEDLNFESLFRSDHLTAIDGCAKRNSLALWPSLTAVAMCTRRIRFGSMVCSITFIHPAMLAKMAAAVDVLSGGRFELGIGAGWKVDEHRMFGLDFPPTATRLEMLDEAAQVIKALWSGHPATITGQHYRLEAAETYPLPLQDPPPLIMGGRGAKMLRVVARHATEWNCAYVDLNTFCDRSRLLDDYCTAIGRDPSGLRRSIELPFAVGKDEATIERRLAANRAMFPTLPRTRDAWLAAGLLAGSPAQLVDQLKAWEAAGVHRILLQHNNHDDIESLELLASEVLPHFA